MIKESAYKTIDSRLKINKRRLVAYAKRKGYKYYSELVCERLENGSCRNFLRELKENVKGTIPTAVATAGVRRRVLELADGLEKPKFEKKKGRICKKDGCNNIIPENNHSFCKACFINNKKISVETVWDVPL